MAGRPQTYFSPEMMEFIKKNYLKMTDIEMAETISKTFEIDRTADQVGRCRVKAGFHKPRIRKDRLKPEDLEVRTRLSVRGAVTIHRCI